MNKKQLVISIFGGPGIRKSTMCHHLTAELKWLGINCEMAPEYAKVKVWEKSTEVLKDQLYILGKQYHAVKMLEGQVDVILTDSPVLLSIIYDKSESKDLYDLALTKYHEFYNMPILLTRKAPYNPSGRMQTKEGAIELDTKIEELLLKEDPLFFTFPGERDSVKLIVNAILRELENRK